MLPLAPPPSSNGVVGKALTAVVPSVRSVRVCTQEQRELQSAKNVAKKLATILRKKVWRAVLFVGPCFAVRTAHK